MLAPHTLNSLLAVESEIAQQTASHRFGQTVTRAGLSSGRVAIFARIMPEQKLRVVQALKADGEMRAALLLPSQRRAENER
jgi:hypothetical protein